MLEKYTNLVNTLICEIRRLNLNGSSSLEDGIVALLVINTESKEEKEDLKRKVASCILDLLSCLCDTPINRSSMELNSSKVMAGVGEKVMTEPDIKILEVCVSVTQRTSQN